MKELIIKKGDKQITVADKEDVTNALNNKSNSTHGHGNLQSDGSVGTSNNTSKNVVTDANGKITTEAKPTIPTKTSDLTNDSNYTTATGHNHDSTYIKKTGGVSQHSTGNIIIPSASDTSAVDATGKIPFAGHLVSTTYSIEEFTTKLKSFIGGLKDKDNRWWNVISVRQTNGGGSEAESNGLIFKSILDTNSNLLWNKERNGTWGTERTILDSSNYSNYANKTTVTDNLTTDSSTNALSAKQGKILNNRYKGIKISSANVPSKPYLRLFNIESKASLSSGHLIFEIFGINNDSSYAKVRVDLRRSNSSPPSGTCAVVPLNISKRSTIYDNLYFAHYIGTDKSYVDIFFKTTQFRDCIFKVYDDQLRDGKYTMYQPIVATNVANDVETYTTVEEAGTALYNASYTNIINKSYNDIVASSFIKDGGTSSQFLKADGSVDSNTYSTSNHNHDSTYIKTGTGTVTSTNIADGTIVNGDIANTTITGGKLVNGTITATQLASNAVETAKIKDANVTTAKIADSAVTSAKIADKTIVAGDIADTTITGGKLVSGTVTATQLASNSVTTAKIADKAVTNAKLNPVVFYGNGSGATAGYIKTIKFVVGAAWSDKPITFDLYNRVRKDNIHVSLKFKNDSTTDPEIDFFSYTSYDSVDLYAYKEGTSTWSIIIQKEANGNFEIANLVIPEYLRSTLSYANMNTQISALPSDTTANPLIKATQRTYGGTSNNNITAPAFIKSNGQSSQFLKADGSVDTVVNNLTTDSSTRALSATQGKWLYDNKIEKAGTNLSKSGTTLNHATSGSGSLTTATLKKVKFDAQGHITGTADPNSVTCTVTDTNGNTSTINLVTR